MVGFGLFVDLRRWEGSVRAPAAHVARVMELVAGAEGRGLDAVWLTEHHGFPDGYLAQPMVLAAALAARTSRLRIGTAVVLAPLRHSRHVAEEAAMVDLVSDGRFELGLGAGYGAVEYAMFGRSMDGRFGDTDAVAAEVARLFAAGEVTPGPVQDPFPLWLGYQGPQGARRAGRLGLGLLSLDPNLLGPYQEGLAEAGHDPASARMGGLVELVVADDPEAAAQRIVPHWIHQQNTYRALRTDADGRPLRPLEEGPTREKLAATGRLGGLTVVDVDGAVASLRNRLAAVPARHVYSWLTVADMPDDLVDRHVELWCGPVRAALAGRS